MFLRNISKSKASFPTKNGNIVVDNNKVFSAEDIIDLKGLLLLGAVEIVEDNEIKHEATNDNQETVENEVADDKAVKETKKPNKLNKLNKGRGKKAE